jgi:ribosomal protein L11 methyltransferase
VRAATVGGCGPRGLLVERTAVPVAVIRASVIVAAEQAELLRARFIELAPEGFEEVEHTDGVELAAYGAAAERVSAAFAHASTSTVEEGWEERWRTFHRPVEIGPLWVGPPGQSPPDGLLAVVIEPGRAFGTGAHPTTRLCLELMLEQQPGSLVDLGCGSGVLAIAAAALGFAPVLGVDLDPLAVEVARTNARLNGVEVELRQLDVAAGRLPPASVAVANIAAEVIAALGPRLDSPYAITSGYRAVDHPQPVGFCSLRRVELDGWAADLFVRG